MYKREREREKKRSEGERDDKHRERERWREDRLKTTEKGMVDRSENNDTWTKQTWK